VPVQDRMTPRNLYLYTVCLVMLLIGVVAAVLLVRSAIGIAYPEAPVSFEWTAYTPIDEASGSFASDAVEDEQRRQAIKETVAAGTALLLAGSVYAFHWRRVQADRAGADIDEAPAALPAP
jgi:hypothetical protein